MTSSSDINENAGGWRSPAALVTLAVLVAAIAIRLWIMPPLYNQQQHDETGYLTGGLLMLEGATPGYKFAPGAVTTWPGFVYGAWTSFTYLVNPTEEIAKQPTVLKPLYAIDQALFDAYADFSGVRAAVMWTVMLTTLFGVFMACRLGAYRAGWPGALLAGGLMAFMPVIAMLSIETRPYAAAWSLGLAAVAFAAISTGRWRWIGTGICFGLAVASRIDVVLIAPIIIWEFWLRPEKTQTLRALLRIAGISIVTFLVAAPWYLTHLVGNIRKVVTVPLETKMADNPELWSGLLNLLWSEGLWAVVALILVGLALRSGRERMVAIVAGLFLVAMLLAFGGGHLARYNSAAWVGIVALAPYALASLRERYSERFSMALAGLAAALVLLPTLGQTVNQGLAWRASWVEPRVVEWLKENVEPGTLIYSYPRQIKAIAPTAESAEMNWRKNADPDAWRVRMQERLSHTDLVMQRVPRALSIEHMYQRLGAARRSFFLASDHWEGAPRYNIRITSLGSLDSEPLTWGQAGRETVEEFLATGGVFIHYGWAVPALGEPAVTWLADNGDGIFVYIRNGVNSGLKEPKPKLAS